MDEEGWFIYFDVRIEGLTMFVQIDIFSKDAIILPVNHSNTHWTSAAINFRKKRISLRKVSRIGVGATSNSSFALSRRTVGELGVLFCTIACLRSS